MKSKHIFLIIVAVLIVIILPFICSFIKQKSQKATIESEAERGLSVLSENNLSVYMLYDRLFKLDNESGTWSVQNSNIYSEDGETAIRRSQIAIHDGKIYYADFGDNTIKVASINTNSIPTDLTTESYGPTLFSVSQDGRMLAYRCCLDSSYRRVGIKVLEIETTLKRLIYEHPDMAMYKKPIDSIAWGNSDQALFFSRDNKITKVDLNSNTTEEIAEGFWVERQSANVISFWRNNGRDIICYRKYLQSNIETELLRIEHPQTADWDDSGRYVLVNYKKNSRSILRGHKIYNIPYLWDIEQGKKYRLPSHNYYSDCLFIVSD